MMQNGMKGLAALLGVVALAGAAQATPVPGQGSWQTTLQGRDLDANMANGFEAFYDTALDISWLRSVNSNPNAPDSGFLTWAQATAWAQLPRYGISGWRLPTLTDAGSNGCPTWGFGGTECGYNVTTTDSEMAHWFYDTLGNKAQFDTAGSPQGAYGLTNTGDFLFSNPAYAPGDYWIGVLAPNDYAFYFNAQTGRQFTVDQGLNGTPAHAFAMAVRDGDVGANPTPPANQVPEPQTLALTLAGMAILRRRMKTERADS